MTSEKIGIVVIGRNEGKRLIDCLASCKGTSRSIVYVDSGSTDNSLSEAASAGALVIRLNLESPFTAARARNEGFWALKRMNPNVEFVQFIDGDCLLVKSWLELASSFLIKHEDVAVVCGRRRERFPERSVYNRLCDLEWDTPVGEAAGCGGDSLVRIKAFEDVAGFRSEIMAGEEPEMCVRLREKGWKIWRLQANMTEHDVNMTRFIQWWHRSVRSGHGYAEVSRLSRASRFNIYQRETARAISWGLLLPLFIIFGTCFTPWVLAMTAIYSFQVVRLAASQEGKSTHSLSYAFFTVLSKFPESEGVAKYYWHFLTGRNAKPIEYKNRH